MQKGGHKQCTDESSILSLFWASCGIQTRLINISPARKGWLVGGGWLPCCPPASCEEQCRFKQLSRLYTIRATVFAGKEVL